MRFLIGLIILIHGYGCSMATADTITPTISVSKKYVDNKPVSVAWSSLTSSDTSVYVEPGEAKNMSVQATGTFGGSTITLQGSNDCTNFYALRDVMQGAVSMTSAGLMNVTTRAKCVKPVVTGGTGSLDIYLYYSN